MSEFHKRRMVAYICARLRQPYGHTFLRQVSIVMFAYLFGKNMQPLQQQDTFIHRHRSRWLLLGPVLNKSRLPATVCGMMLESLESLDRWCRFAAKGASILPLQGALAIDVVTALLGITPLFFFATPQAKRAKAQVSSVWQDFSFITSAAPTAQG